MGATSERRAVHPQRPARHTAYRTAAKSSDATHEKNLRWSAPRPAPSLADHCTKSVSLLVSPNTYFFLNLTPQNLTIMELSAMPLPLME
jgi:hypothetical protein